MKPALIDHLICLFFSKMYWSILRYARIKTAIWQSYSYFAQESARYMSPKNPEFEQDTS